MNPLIETEVSDSGDLKIILSAHYRGYMIYVRTYVMPWEYENLVIRATIKSTMQDEMYRIVRQIDGLGIVHTEGWIRQYYVWSLTVQSPDTRQTFSKMKWKEIGF